MATDHFETHGSNDGRIDWNFNIVFKDQPQVARMVEKYAKLIEHPGLYPPIPVEWLHATILRVGTIDEYTEQEMLEVAMALKPKLGALNLPEFKLGPWWLWGGSPVLHMAPEDPLISIFDLVMSEIKSVVGAERMPQPTRFIPHVTMAYNRTYNETVDVYQMLQDNPIEPVSFRATQMPLIKQRVEGNVYMWDVVEDLVLGSDG